VYHPGAVGLHQPSSHLDPEPNGLGNGQGTPLDFLLERLAFEVLHADEHLPVIGFVDVMHHADVVVLKGGRGLRLVDEALLGFLVAGELWGEELERDGAVELEIPGLVDHTHPSPAEVFEDVVVRNRLTNERRHDSSFKWGAGGKITQNRRIVKRGQNLMIVASACKR